MDLASLVPLPVAIPLASAALLGALGKHAPRRLADAVALAATAATIAISALLVDGSARDPAGPLVYWFGGWRPRGDVALGVGFAVDPLGAGLALLAAVLVACALVFA